MSPAASKPTLTITLCASPDPDYAPESHKGSVRIAAREFLVLSLPRAIETFGVFVVDNQLSPGNLVGSGLVRCEGAPLCRVSHDGKLLAVDSEGRATGLRYVDPGASKPKFRSLGKLVRFLREDSGLIRRQVAEAVGVAPETLRNLELGRHRTNPWSWAKILSHPALQDLPRLAEEAGLELPRGVVPGSPGGRGTPAPRQGGTGETLGPWGGRSGTPAPQHGGSGDSSDGEGVEGGSGGVGGST